MRRRTIVAARVSVGIMRNKIVRKRNNVKLAVGPEAPLFTYVAALHRTVHALALYFEAALEGNVTQAEAVVLLHLAWYGASTINNVHRAFLHKRSTLTSVVDRLERKGLVERRIGEDDRRNFVVGLTHRGARAAERVVAAVAALAPAASPADFSKAAATLNATAERCLLRT